MFRVIVFFNILFLGIIAEAKCTEKSLGGGNNKILFDFDWRFHLGTEKTFAAPSFNDTKWRKLNLPHDWSIEGIIDKNNPSGNDGGYFPNGTGWYRKTFSCSSQDKGKKVQIYFEGVYMNAEVFINGKSLGTRPYGYTSFYYDLTPYLKFDKPNILAVKVDNSQQKNSRWYSGSGIYRHVWLITSDRVHMPQWGIKFTAAEINKKFANTKTEIMVKNESELNQKLTLITLIKDEYGKVAGRNISDFFLKAGQEKLSAHSIKIFNPRLWNVNAPNRYLLEVNLVRKGKIVDNKSMWVGIRDLIIDSKRGMLLNGDPIKLNGGCIHHDNGALGAAAYDRAEKRKVELLKKAGFNAVRTSHNPPSEKFLEACDQLGMLVIDESFDGWRSKKKEFDYAQFFDAWWAKDVENWILRDRNHPSVIAWSTGNEVFERKEPQAVLTARKLRSRVKEFDSTRPVLSAITTWDATWDNLDPLFAEHDLAGYNYQLHRAPGDHIRKPLRTIVQTESYPRDAFKNWKLVMSNDYIIGDFVWTAMDYLGESGIGRFHYEGEPNGEVYERDLYPWHGAYCGDLDLTGWRKPISHYRDLLYNENKKFFMAVKEPDGYYGKIKETLWSVWPTWESWTWPGHEGKRIEVEVYSRYPNVRLFINNKLVEEKSCSQANEFKVVFSVPYQAGELRAEGWSEKLGKETSVKLRTAGPAEKISLSCDRKVVSADGQDLCYVYIEIQDIQGNYQPNAENLLQFELDGPGEIVAVDNANLKDLDPYRSNKRKAWKGKALVILKSSRKAGSMTLKVKSEGLIQAQTSILSSSKKNIIIR